MIQLVMRTVTGWRVVIAAALVIGSPLLFRLGPYATIKDRVGGRPLPEEKVTTPEELRAFLAGLDETTRALYGRFQLWDVANPLVLAVAATLFLAWLLKRAGLDTTRWRWTVALPAAMAVADLLENVVLWAAIGRYPDVSPVAAALPLMSGLKFTLVGGVLLSIVAGIIAYFVRRRRLPPVSRRG